MGSSRRSTLRARPRSLHLAPGLGRRSRGRRVFCKWDDGPLAFTDATAPTRSVRCSKGVNAANVPATDVINFSQSINVRDPVRVLVRREGGPNAQDSVSSSTPGTNLKHTYFYLALTGSARVEASGPLGGSGPGTIGSGRAGGNGASAEAAQAREYKLETLANMLDDYPLWQAIIHVGSFSTLEAVVVSWTVRRRDGG
jgi:hypothetical protein